ncbi:hypothetical protein, partial [uncultured Gimesia sp.]
MSQTAKIDIYHGRSRLAPSIDRNLLKDLIEFPAKEFSCKGNGVIREDTTDTRLWRECSSGQTIVLTGLVPAILERLNQSGVEVEVIEHRRFPKRQILSQTVLRNSSGDEREFLLAI